MTPSTQNHHIKTPPLNKPTPSIPSSRARIIPIPRCHTPKSANASRLRFPTLTKKGTTWTQMRTAKTCPNTSKRRRQPIGITRTNTNPATPPPLFLPLFTARGPTPTRGHRQWGCQKKHPCRETRNEAPQYQNHPQFPPLSDISTSMASSATFLLGLT